MAAKITFRKSTRKGSGFYDVLADGQYVGFVMRSGNRWENSKQDDLRYATRREATEAMAPFIVAELAAVTHYANATSNDPTRSFYRGEIYQASQVALKAAIRAAYPDMDVEAVYDAWVDCGETIGYVVRALRAEIEALHEYALELNAEWDAERAPERDVTIDISGDDVYGYMVVLVAVFPEATKADGFTRAGTPFARTTVHYMDLGAARRMVDVMVAEFRDDTSKVWSQFTVTLTGLASLSSRLSEVPAREAIDSMAERLAERAVRIRAGGSFRGPVVTSGPAVEPTYRKAGFPSLDAAIGAGYAVR